MSSSIQNRRTSLALRVLYGGAAVALFAWMACDLLRPTPDAERHRLMRLIESLHAETQSAYNGTLESDRPAAEFIRSNIVPAFDQVKAEVEAFEPAHDADRDWQASMLDFLTVMTGAWELMADALDRGSIVTEGKAHEQYEAGMQILRSQGITVNQPAPSMHVEIALFLTADARIETTYIERQAGELTNTELADVLEAELLPAWSAARERFLAASDEPPAEYQRSVSRLWEYAELRDEAFRLQVESLRESNAEKTMQARELIDKAREIREAIMRDGLTQ